MIRPTTAQRLALRRAYDELCARVWNELKFRDPIFEEPEFLLNCIALGEAARAILYGEGTGQSQ